MAVFVLDIALTIIVDTIVFSRREQTTGPKFHQIVKNVVIVEFD